MSDGSSIEWTEATWNPVRGCTKVSPGCKHCYAETFAERWRGIAGHPFEQGFDLRLVPEKLDAPLRWKKARKIFVNSMSDLFHEDVPDEYIAAVFGVMAACQHHTFQILTKRAERLPRWFSWIADNKGWGSDGTSAAFCWRHAEKKLASVGDWFVRTSSPPAPGWPLPNVHLGVSVEDQAMAEERIPLLLQTPAAVRWISAEPLLGPLSIAGLYDGAGGEIKPLVGLHWVPGRDGAGVARMVLKGGKGPKLDWVVVGAESGAGRHTRPMEQDWVRRLRDDCTAAGTAFFYKQDATPAGRKIKLPVLDGRQWQEYPR